MASSSASNEDHTKLCNKSRRCGKQNKHPGPCNKLRDHHQFWMSSPVQVANARRTADAQLLQREMAVQAREINAATQENMAAQAWEDVRRQKEAADLELAQTERENQRAKEEKLEIDLAIEELNKKYEELKLLFEQKVYARKRREASETNMEMISNYRSKQKSTRYRRRQETKNVLTFIHGGEAGSVYGCWDYFSDKATKDQFEALVTSYNRGAFLEGIFNKGLKDMFQSDDAFRRSIAMKYKGHLSRRNFNFLCKTQSSAFDPNSETWIPRNLKIRDVELRIPNMISHEKISKFVNALDIGYISSIPGHSGASRTVTGLTFLILDLHLRLDYLQRKLIWFKGNKMHFVIQFSDDGAPETSQQSMSIGSITLWNFGEHIMSRDYQYLLHCVSVPEKSAVMELLWQQHSDEMQLLEGNILHVGDNVCTVEFLPSADQSWQSWANNELNQAATYPSPFANVHKGELTKMNGSIGFGPQDTWVPPTMSKREKDLKLLNNFRTTLKRQNVKESTVHKKELDFMATNGIRQLGYPRIGIFADRQRPDPIHCELNSWSHILNLIYLESKQRGTVQKLLDVLKSPVVIQGRQDNESLKTTDIKGSALSFFESDAVAQFTLKLKSLAEQNSITQALGCGLPFISAKVKEHFDNKSECENSLKVRLIGQQSINLARNCDRLVDCLLKETETPLEKLRRIVLGKIVQALRDAGTLFNRINVHNSYIADLTECCKMYFNLFALFFPEHTNITVWTVGYAIPYFANDIFKKYGTGYGMLSLQAKEAKHAAIKNDLRHTNRSKLLNLSGKWMQVMRADYVRNFYLPEHEPLPSQYNSHFTSRIPVRCQEFDNCECGRKLSDSDDLCNVCCEFSLLVMPSVVKGFLTESLTSVMKPLVCGGCGCRFADVVTMELHRDGNSCQRNQNDGLKSKIDPHSLTVSKLKEELHKRGLSSSGSKSILIMRLEGALTLEL